MSRPQNSRRLEPISAPTFARRIGVSLATLAALASFIRCNSNIEPSVRPENVPPQVSETAPASDAEGVSPQVSITVVFTETMNAATIHPGTYRVSALGTPQAGVIVGQANRFTFKPDSLPGNQVVEVEIRDVADLAGNMLAEPYRFAFETSADAPPPPHEPSNPNPPDHAPAVSVNPMLTWEGGSPNGAPVTYDVWLGTSLDNLTRRAQNLEDTSFQVGPLPDATEHFWQIIARSAGGDTQGPIWSFTTEAGNLPPLAPCNPTPANSATEVPTNTTLSWQCLTDPDGDPLTFDIYFGTETNPPLVATQEDGPPYSPGQLAVDTRYYWRVVANDGRGGTTSGPVWTFRTFEPNDPPTPPATPISPPQNSDNIDLNVNLTWSGGNDPDGDPVTYDVRFGRSNPPPFLATTNEKTYRVENLDPGPGTRYRWQIVARDDHGHQTPGPVWRFDTQDAPSVPCEPEPQDGDNSVHIIVELKWECGNDSQDPVTFDVYFGNTPDPSFLVSTTQNHYGPFAVGLGTYYWRIVARDDRGAQSEGPVWSFTTALGREGAK